MRISEGARYLDILALIDEGSTISLVDREAMREIDAHGERVRISLQGFRENDAVTADCYKVAFDLEAAHTTARLVDVLAVQDLRLPQQCIPESLAAHVRNTQRIILDAYTEARPRLLLGQDNAAIISTLEFRQLNPDGLAISRSQLGWAIHGPSGNCTSGREVNLNASAHASSGPAHETNLLLEEERLDELLQWYFSVESLGIGGPEDKKITQGRAEKILEATSRNVGDAWETGLLWKQDEIPQVDSWSTAYSRLRSLERKLDRDANYASLYYKEMARFVGLGYAKKIVAKRTDARAWYLPHFGVINANKPGKIRLVFDAAAKSQGVSLNDQLLKGPDLLKSLPGILLRFREHAVAIKGDISDMFLRIRMRKEDRAAQRFLWRGSDRSAPPEAYEMTTLMFGAASSPCSAIYVKNKNAESHMETEPAAAAAIINNCYMDNLLDSRRTPEEAAQIIREIIAINKTDDFTMHGWICSDSRAFEGIVDQEQSQVERRLCDREEERVLGLYWNAPSDTLVLTSAHRAYPRKSTMAHVSPRSASFCASRCRYSTH